MSTAKDIAENAAFLGAAAVATLVGGGAGLVAYAGPVAALMALGHKLRTGGAAAVTAAEKNARAALENAPDFTPTDHARARTLLAEAGDAITLRRADLITASKDADLDFNAHLVAILLAPVPFAADDDAPRRILTLSLTAAIDTLRADPDFDRKLTQSLLLNAARDAGVHLELLHQMVAQLDRIEKMMVSELAEQARQHGLKEGAVLGLAKGIAPTVRNFDEAMTALGEAVKIANRLTARGDAGSNIDAFVDQVLRDLARLTRAGDFDAAAETAQAAADQAEAGLAQIFNAAIDAHLLARNADAAAAQIVKRVALDTPPDLFAALREEFQKRYTNGRNNGLRLELEVAIALARSNQAHAITPDQTGTACNDLGIALWTLGERDTDSDRQLLAIEAYNEALTKRTRERVPLNWAMTQNNLGLALRTLGTRELSTERLQQAVNAFAQALTEWTRERVPLLWATTQNNIGMGLATLGESDPGTDQLQQSVEAYTEALKEWTRERTPLLWATTQHNLGSALHSLGKRESGTARLEQAVAAYHDALAERKQDRVPLDWAATQNNLGNVLRTLGARETGTARLEQAVDAYRAALTEYTQDRVPLDWAMTQNNLGNALATLGARETGTARLEQAVDAYRAALIERTQDRVPLDWAATQNNLGNALLALGARETKTAQLEQAVAVFGTALTVRTQDRVPLDWAGTRHNMAGAHIVLFDRTGDAAQLDLAETAVTEARGVFALGAPMYLRQADQYLADIAHRRS